MSTPSPRDTAAKFQRKVKIIKMILLWVIPTLVTIGFTLLSLALHIPISSPLPCLTLLMAAIVGFGVACFISMRYVKKMNAIPVAERIAMMK